MKRAIVGAIVLVCLQLALVLLWSKVEKSREQEKKTEPIKKVSTKTVVMNQKAPDFRYQLSDGSFRDFARWKGKPVIVHFWATWCPPCRRELPSLLAFARKYKVPLLAVSFDTSWKKIRRAWGKTTTEPIVLVQAPQTITKSYAVKIFPVTYIVNRKGYFTLRFDGARDWNAKPFLNTVLAAMK